jgi:dTMP kinase
LVVEFDRMSGVDVNTDDASWVGVSVGYVSRYIALEGVDGSGKSTIAAALARRLEAEGHPVTMVREPGGTTVGEAVRGLLLDSESLDPWTEAYLFAAQRAELAHEVIRPALDKGHWVISDRTYYSSIAYQGRARGLGEGRIKAMNEMGLDGIVPDKVFVLDVPPADALPRQHREDRIGGESPEFQEEVRRAYIEMAARDPDRVHLLDGTGTVEALVEEIVEALG